MIIAAKSVQMGIHIVIFLAQELLELFGERS